MVAYQHFVALSHSADSEQRGEAAHMVASAFVEHDGSPDEQAALYASVLGFLDDPSVKVRASLAYGLLHSDRAPRLVMLALIKDAPIIARAVIQYSPVLIDIDLIGVVQQASTSVLLALVEREQLSYRLMEALVERGDEKSLVRLLTHEIVKIPTEILANLAKCHLKNAKIRGKLLTQENLPAYCRLQLVEQISKDLGTCRMVKGAIAPARVERLMRDALDNAATQIGEAQAMAGENTYAQKMQEDDRVNTRVLLHSIVHGHVLFFADCIALISGMPTKKIFTLLERGARVALNALFTQCGMNDALRNLLSRLVLHARNADLSNDDAARHFVVSALIEELIIEHGGDIPKSLEEAFRYLDEQNVVLARSAARGVMSAFTADLGADQLLLDDQVPEPGQVPGQLMLDVQDEAAQDFVPPVQLALPAA